MSYSEQMKKCEAYIAEHLNEPITAAALAQQAGYSLYHFCRVFKALYGISPGEFVRRCKLRAAAQDLLQGSAVLETALEYGYDTHSGFTKAFEKEFGVAPIVYRKLRGERLMKVTIQNEKEFKVFGYVIETDDATEGGYWGKIDFSQYPQYPADCDDQGEVAMWIHPEKVSGELKYFFGYKTNDAAPSEGFEEIVIPAAQYAVFEVPAAENAAALAQQMNAAWKEIFSSWFDSVEYKYDETKMCFEFYKEEKSFIYIPVQ
ncbi:MAG: AraC family transcriptional regulator [Clostridia bacterium]|nr:AraC family transcriptional regulator [Clostridia bacterium]